MTYTPPTIFSPNTIPGVTPAPDPVSVLQQVNQGIQQATQPYIPLSLPGIGSPDIQSPIIPGLPSALDALQSKYQTAIPTLQQAISSGQLPSHAVQSLAAYDIRRAKRGQSPLNAEQSAGALQTIASHEAATQEPSRSIFNLFGNAGHDLKTIALSVPHIPSQLYKEVRDLPHIPEAIHAAEAQGENPISAFLHAPGIRMVPGAYTLGNLAEGGKGIHEALTHPLMTGLDVFAGDALLGKAAGVEGGLARTAIAESPFGKTVGSWKNTLYDGIKSTRGGVWAQAAFGDKARSLSKLINGMANQVHIGMDASLGRPALIDPDGMMTSLANGATDLAKKWSPEISLTRMEELTTHMQLDPAHVPDVTDLERGFLNETRDLTDRITAYHIGNGDLEQLVTNGQMEVFPVSDAATIKKAWASRDRYDVFTHVRQAVRNSEVITPDDLSALAPKVQSFLADDRYSGTLKARLGRGYAYAIRGINGTLPDGYLSAIANRDFQAASDLLTDHVPTFDRPFAAREATMRNQWETLTRRYTPSRAAKATSIASDVETETLSARWREWKDKIVSGKVESKLAAYGDANHVDVADLVTQAINRDYRRIAAAGLITADDIGQYTREAAATIAEMKSQGIDPMFVHRTDESAVTMTNYPQPGRGTLTGTVKTPTQLKAPALMATPYVHDVTVALSHQGVEILNRAAQHSIYSELLRTTANEGETIAPFAKTRAELDQIYEGVRTNRANLNPTVDSRLAIEKRMNREWVKFPIDKLPPELKQSLGLIDEMGENHPYIPRAVWKNLELFNKPPDFGIMDPILHAFRTSLLVLSPRFVLYQIIGDAIQVMARTNPITVWKHIGDAREMMGKLGSAEVEGTRLEMPASLRPVIGHVIDPTLEWSFKSGTTISRMLPDSSPFKRIAEAQPFQAAAKKTYGTVSFFTDTYHAMSYLYGYDKALTKGLTRAEAIQAGEALARKSLMAWDQMTAVERTAMRTIFPFYGWAQHILRYAKTYPVDYPFRAAVTAAIARNELADLGTGLPQNMLNMLFLGPVDKHGHVRTINTAGMNPFRDVSNFTTLAGWMNSTNPVIAGLLQSAGLDTSTGGPDLYPNLKYDPETGRLAPAEKNPVLSVLYQTIPQSELLASMLAKSSEIKDLMRLDPAAGMRMIASQGGIPLTYRDYALDRTMIQGEVARQSAQSQAFSNALKSGDYSQARTWPALQVNLNTVQALQQSGALSQFQPGGPNSVQKLQQIQQMIANVG